MDEREMWTLDQLIEWLSGLPERGAVIDGWRIIYHRGDTPFILEGGNGAG